MGENDLLDNTASNTANNGLTNSLALSGISNILTPTVRTSTVIIEPGIDNRGESTFSPYDAISLKRYKCHIPIAETVAQETVWVEAVAGVGLPASDANGFSDCYCVISLESNESNLRVQRRETKHAPKSLDPVWGESFIFNTQDRIWQARNNIQTNMLNKKKQTKLSSSIFLRIMVYDHDQTSAPDLLGEICIDLTLLGRDILSDRWYPLRYSRGAAIRPSVRYE